MPGRAEKDWYVWEKPRPSKSRQGALRLPKEHKHSALQRPRIRKIRLSWRGISGG